MIDVFLRCYAEAGGELRSGMATSCVARWLMQEDANIIILYTRSYRGYLNCNSLSLYPDTFHMESKRFAEATSTTPIYVVADDDCLILGKDFVASGVRVMEDFPKYGILTATSISDGDCRMIGMPSIPLERHAVGGVAFIRKGILKEFPSCAVDKVDETICEEITAAGYKAGVLPACKFNHLGAGYSLSSANCWSA